MMPPLRPDAQERVLINGKEDSDPPYQGNFGLGIARQAANCLKTGRGADLARLRLAELICLYLVSRS